MTSAAILTVLADRDPIVQSTSPFVLDALLEVPRDLFPTPGNQVDRATAFIRRNTQPDSRVGGGITGKRLNS